MRYKFYREHKYVSFALNDLERLIAKTDFRSPEDVAKIRDEFQSIVQMLKGHAHYEDTSLHSLLKKKASVVYQQIEQDHGQLDEQLHALQALLDAIDQAVGEENKVEAGYQFYLAYRKFVGDNLLHLHEEETIILPELQRLYTDQELREVEFKTYRIMTPEELIEMLEVLFPHMNPADRAVFLTDIKDCQPDKFAVVWPRIKSTLPEFEQISLEQRFS